MQQIPLPHMLFRMDADPVAICNDKGNTFEVIVDPDEGMVRISDDNSESGGWGIEVPMDLFAAISKWVEEATLPIAEEVKCDS